MADMKFVGDIAQVGVEQFPFGDPPTPRELGEVARTLKSMAEGWATLRKAQLSFETGGASYEGAWANVRALGLALAQAEHDLNGLYGGIASFYKTGRSPFSAVAESEYLAVATSTIAKLREILMRPKTTPKPEAPKVETPPTV